MKDLNKVLEKKTLVELQAINQPANSGSNLIEPTEAMIEEVIQQLREGKSYLDIKRSVKKEGTNLKLSKGQIKEIHNAMKNKIVELTPTEQVLEVS